MSEAARTPSIVPLVATVAAACLLLGGGLGWLLAHGRPAPRAAPPVLFRAPRYQGLLNQQGRPVSSAAFAGKVQVVSFLFPYCNTFCPVIAAHLVAFENALAGSPLAGKVEVVAFNVDPGGTGPKQMRAFLREYGWNPADPRWQYLTGTPKRVRQVVTGGFHVDYQKVFDSASAAAPQSAALAVAGSDPQPIVANPLADKANVPYDITHEDVLMVVDPEGRVRAIYDQADAVGTSALLRVVQAVAGGH